jgi:hypothetical protein
VRWVLILGSPFRRHHGGNYIPTPPPSHSLSPTPRTRFRREANQADNKAATVAVDALINFEAVKVRSPSFALSPESKIHSNDIRPSTMRNMKSRNTILTCTITKNPLPKSRPLLRSSTPDKTSFSPLLLQQQCSSPHKVSFKEQCQLVT